MNKGFAFKTHEISDFYSMRHMKASKKKPVVFLWRKNNVSNLAEIISLYNIENTCLIAKP